MHAMTARLLFHVDAFTREPFRGNPAAVVLDAEGLSDAQMLSIAREMNLSETVFAFPPDGADHDLLARFFTPAAEVPLCGHATVALHHVLAEEGRRPPAGRAVQKTKAGLIPVDLVEREGRRLAEFTMRDIPFGRVLGRDERQAVLAALRVAPEAWEGRCPMQHVYAGVMIAVKSRACLDALAPDMTALIDVSARLGVGDYNVFTFDSDDPAILTHMRVFAPDCGVNEDPVTGIANGPLAAYLVKHRLMEWQGDACCFRSRQGEAIGRAGTVHLRVRVSGGEPVEVAVGGEAVTVFRTELETA